MEDDVDVWRYAIIELHTRNDDDDVPSNLNVSFKDPLSGITVLDVLYVIILEHLSCLCFLHMWQVYF